MKHITKKLFASAISAVISLTAVAAFTAPAAPVLAAGQSYNYSYNYDMQQYERLKDEGIRYLQNCVSNPSYAAVSLTNQYVSVIRNHRYDVSKTYDQNANELIRYVNNVYKNIQKADNSCKIEAYKAAKLNYLYGLADCPEDEYVVDYVAYAFSYINFNNNPNATLEQLKSEIDQLTAIAERGIK